MPPALKGLKNYESVNEMNNERKLRDNKAQKIRYWRKKYGFDLKIEDYENFNQNIQIIKKTYNIFDLIINFDKNKINGDNLDIYAKNWDNINLGLEIKEYLQKLKKITKKHIIIF